MATITTRSGKGSPLTNSEVDANFTNLNSDKIELTNLSVTTGSASGGGSLAYANGSGVFTFVPPDLSSYLTNLSGQDTDDLSEGSTNVYFTSARARTSVSVTSASASGGGTLTYANGSGVFTFTPPDLSSFLTSLSGLDTDNLTEGSSNLYFTNARARGAVSVTDSGGDGSLAYNSSTGVVTYTGPSASEVRAHFSAGTGVAIASGEVSIGQAVATNSNVTFNNVNVAGDLTVNGTTTTVHSTVVTIDDPVFTLGGDTAPSTDDNKDRGIEFRWHNGTSAKIGFFGFDDSSGKFTFIPDATNNSEVFSGTAGDVVFGAATVTGLTIGSTAVTATAAEINILDGVTSTAAELNLNDGSSAGTIVNSKTVVYGSSGEVNATTLQLSGTAITATAAELNLLDGVTATTAELNYVDGVTSNIQTQLNAKQASDQQLTDIAGLTPTDSGFIVGDGSNFVLESGATVRTSLGLAIGTNVQAYDAQLADIAGLTPSDSGFIVGDGSNFVLESGATVRASLGLAIGTNVLAYDANLQTFVGAFTLPTSDGSSGQALTTNGSGTLAFSDVDALPSQSGNTGYYLKTDGTNASWAAVEALPSQSGNSGYFLTTNGSAASWTNLLADPTFTGTVTINSTEALTLPAGTTGQRPTAATGMLRYNSTLGKVEFYNGSAWSNINVDNAYVRTNITATSGQTSFSVAYTVGYVDVFLNGIKLIAGTDFTATNGTAVVLAAGAATGDLFEAVAWNAANVAQQAYTKTSFTATASQTTFTVDYTVGFVNVYLNGVLLLDGTEYTATNGTSIVLAAGAAVNDSVVVEAFTTFSASSALAIANNLSDLNNAATALTNLGLTATAAELNIMDGVTSTAAELNILDGVTSTAAELNLVDGSSAGTIANSKAVVYGSSGEVNATTLQISGTAITSTAAELNILDGVTATAAELNILDGVTATAAELNILDGVTATTAELNYTDGVTSNIQTQLDAKQALDANLTSFVSAFTLPTSDGSNGQVLTTNGSGTLSLADAGGGVMELANGNTTLKLSGSSVGAQSIVLATNNSALASTNEGVVVIGYEAAAASVGTSFDDSVVIGGFAARNIQSTRNVVVGHHAVSSNTMTGQENTVLGYKAGQSITSGEMNIHIGSEAGNDSTAGTHNHCILIGNATDTGGNYTVAVGHRSGAQSSSNYSGAGNTYLGSFAGDQGNDSGDYNIAIGYQARTSTGSQSNKFVIGYNFAGRDESDTISIGNNSAYIYNRFADNSSWSRQSDERLKKDFNVCDLGLNFINDLEPVTYRWKPVAEVDPSLLQEDAKDRPRLENYYVGLKAQNVKAALDKHAAHDYGIVDVMDDTSRMGLAYEELITPLIQAIKELSAKVDSLESEITELKSKQ